MTTSIVQDNPQEKNCFILDSNNLGYETTIHRICTTEYIDANDFKNRAKLILENEKHKSLLSGKNWNPGVWVIANKFKDHGEVIEKHLASMISKRLNTVYDINVYPSSSLSFNFVKSVKRGLAWDQNIEGPEADFTSVFATILSIHQKYPEYKVTSDFQSNSVFNQGFLDLAKEQLNYVPHKTFGPLDADILITDKIITPEYSTQLIQAKPKIIVLCNDLGFSFKDANNPHNKPIHELIEKNIQVIPPFISTIGNSLIAEGIASAKRDLEESFKLTQNLISHFNSSIWDFALNSRINYCMVVSEIFNSIADDTNQTRFQLSPYDVGTMSYLA